MAKRVRNNPALGTVTCMTCSQEATVHQQARGKGRFLYLRGCECKYNASTGKTFQQYLWDHTTWSSGAQPVKPSNVDDGTPADYDPAPAAAPEVKKETSTPRGDGDPAAGEAEPAAGEGMPKGGKVAAWLGALSLAAAAVVTIIFRGKA